MGPKSIFKELIAQTGVVFFKSTINTGQIVTFIAPSSRQSLVNEWAIE